MRVPIYLEHGLMFSNASVHFAWVRVNMVVIICLMSILLLLNVPNSATFAMACPIYFISNSMYIQYIYFLVRTKRTQTVINPKFLLCLLCFITHFSNHFMFFLFRRIILTVGLFLCESAFIAFFIFNECLQLFSFLSNA